MKQLVARDVMNPDVITVAEDMTLGEVATFLTERQISGAPVVNDQGTMVGVISLTDIAEGAADSGDIVSSESGPDIDVRSWQDQFATEEVGKLHVEYEGKRVADMMTPTVYTIVEETPVAEIAKTMIAGRLHRLFVTREDRQASSPHWTC